MGRLHEILILQQRDRGKLANMMSRGKFSVTQLKRAKILIKNDDTHSAKQIALEVGGCEETVRNIRNKYIEGRLAMTLYDAPRPSAPKKVFAEHEAVLTSIACSEVQ